MPTCCPDNSPTGSDPNHFLPSGGLNLDITRNDLLDTLPFPQLTGTVRDFDVGNNSSLCQSGVTALQGQVTVTGSLDTTGNDSGC